MESLTNDVQIGAYPGPFLGDLFQIMTFLYKLSIGFSKNPRTPSPPWTPLCVQLLVQLRSRDV